MSCEEQYTLYKEFPIWCDMMVRCSNDPPCEKTAEHEARLEKNIFCRLNIQVLAPQKMRFEDLRNDWRTYAFIDKYWRSLMVPASKEQCGEVYDFNCVSATRYQTNHPSETATTLIYLSPSDVVDTWRIMQEVERESMYDKSKPLLILPNVAYMIPPH